MGFNFEVINKPRFSRCSRCLGHVFFVHQHVDEAALSHVAATNEGELRFVGRRALVKEGGGFEEGSVGGEHFLGTGEWGVGTEEWVFLPSTQYPVLITYS